MNELELLNQRDQEKRLSSLEMIFKDSGNGKEIVSTEEVNNHVHTIYSFSPYSPSAAVYQAWKAGLKAVGCMDHDSVAGCRELIDACKIVGIGSTVGFELRTNFSGTVVEGKRLNSPDSKNIGYIAIHGIPEKRLPDCADFLAPINHERNIRNEQQVKQLNFLLSDLGLDPLDFERDVVPLSMAHEGGSITERHILFALVNQLVCRCGKGQALVDFLRDSLHLSVPERIGEYLKDEQNPHYEYDLLGLLKSTFIDKIFIQPNYKECVSVFQAVEFANAVGAIPAYAYLGDVTDSPTGDKKAQKFEDDFLDILMPQIKKIGFRAVTYMPPRNTLPQLMRIQSLCEQYELMEISGVDINSSRQVFNCPIILEKEFRHLADATWALIAHEKMSSQDEKYGLFSRENPYYSLPLQERIGKFTKAGRSMDPFHPETILKTWNFKE